jgi:hypothetical protein
LFLQAEQFDRAAAALLRCEQAAEDDPALRKKVGPELVTCLRRLGLYGEVGRELSRRVEAGAEDVQQGKVLATLGGEPLTEADLDRLIERRVDQMLAMQGATGVEALRQQAVFWFVNRDGKFAEKRPDADGIFRSEVYPGLWLDPAALIQRDVRRLQAVLRTGLATREHIDFAAQLAAGRATGAGDNATAS